MAHWTKTLSSTIVNANICYNRLTLTYFLSWLARHVTIGLIITDYVERLHPCPAHATTHAVYIKTRWNATQLRDAAQIFFAKAQYTTYPYIRPRIYGPWAVYTARIYGPYIRVVCTGLKQRTHNRRITTDEYNQRAAADVAKIPFVSTADNSFNVQSHIAAALYA